MNKFAGAAQAVSGSVRQVVSNQDGPYKDLEKQVRKYAAERGTDDVRSAVFYLGDLSMKVAQTQLVSWRDWGDFFG